jgi:hypothetical protein
VPLIDLCNFQLCIKIEPICKEAAASIDEGHTLSISHTDATAPTLKAADLFNQIVYPLRMHMK